MTVRVPPFVAEDWALHRVALSRRYPDDLHTICTRWSVVDVFDALAVIDALEEAGA